jgi:hypothetical protein
MTAMSNEESLRLFPALADLLDLMHAGWYFLKVDTQDGQPIEYDGFRAWPGGWTDGIRIWSETNVLGIRTSPHEPPSITWERTGTLTQVVGELLTLPVPDARTAPRFALGSAPQLWTP